MRQCCYIRCYIPGIVPNDQSTQTGYFTLKMISQSHQNQLILASASIYRKEQMQRFRIPFTCQAAEIDEAALPGESTAQQTARLALKKAETVAVSFPDAYIIGSDQLADFAGQRVGKPGSVEKAVAQLLQFSGRKVSFLSSVALI